MMRFNSKEDFLNEYSSWEEFASEVPEIVVMSRNLFTELTGHEIEFKRDDVTDDDRPIARCAVCGSEIIQEEFVGGCLGYIDDDGVYQIISEDDTAHESWVCIGCSEEIEDWN